MNQPKPPESGEFKKGKRPFSSRVVAAGFKAAITLAAVSELGIRDGIAYARSGESIAGLIDGAIIGHRLAYVDEERGHIIYKQATKGGLVAYDAMRPAEFPGMVDASEESLVTEGVLWGLQPKELKGNPADMRTPTGYVELYNFDQLMTIDKYPIEQLIGEQILRSVSLAEAFDRVGLGEHIHGLERRSLAHDRVYQVTPKGNTLLRLEEDDGDPSPKREAKKSFVTVPGLLTHG